MHRAPLLASIGLLRLAVSAQSGFPPPLSPDIVTIPVAAYPGVSISYKETHICEEYSKAWSGYVHMPSSYLQDVEGPEHYNIMMFFWYFEARNHPQEAPTAIYLAGGPGQSSMFGVLSDGGPCYTGSGSNSTYNNEWSMNTDVNMLYVDQPVGTGFSYDALIPSTFDTLFLGGLAPTDTGIVPIAAYNGSVPGSNSTFLHGVLPSQDPLRTSKTSAIAGRTLWHFSEAWFSAFPEWRTCEKRNIKIGNGDLRGTILALDTIGITNGCLDMLYQVEYYPRSAYNNTYNLKAINETFYEAALNFTYGRGGCLDQIMQCRELDQVGANEKVNSVCANTSLYCAEFVLALYDVSSNRSDFDMAHLKPDPFAPYYLAGYLNRAWVQDELGVPLNFTADSTLVSNTVSVSTGDAFRTAGTKSIEYLLEHHMKVALAYGDRDYRCPWLGGEAFSLQVNWTGADDFRHAGYETLNTNDIYHGGVVRQHGDLSFTRVFESGHDVAAYQPETNLRIFNRAVFGKDIATGLHSAEGYSSSGSPSSFGIKNVLPPPPPPICHLYDVSALCTYDQYIALVRGTAQIEDFVVVEPTGGGGPIIGFVGGF